MRGLISLYAEPLSSILTDKRIIYIFLSLLFLWQAGTVFAFMVDEFSLAFWIIALPILIWFSLDDPKKAVALMLVFTLLDNVSRETFYSHNNIHSFPILEALPQSHIIFLLLIPVCWIIRRVLVGEQIYIGKFGWLWLSFAGLWIMKFIISAGGLRGIQDGYLLRLLVIIPIYFVYINELKSAEKIIFVMRWAVISSIMMIGYGYYQLISGDYTIFHVGSNLPYVLHQYVIPAMFLPLFYFWIYLLGAKSSLERYGGFLLILLFLVIVPFSLKRGVMLGTYAGFLMSLVMYYRKKIKRFLLLIPIVAAGLFISIWALSQSVFNKILSELVFTRLEAISLSNMDSSGALRVIQIFRGIKMLKEDFLIGLPYAQKFTIELPFIKSITIIDNNYLFIALMGGGLSLILFLFILFYFYRQSFRLLNLLSDDRQKKALVIGCIAMVTAMCVGDLFETFLVHMRVTPFYLLAFAIIYILENEELRKRGIKRI